jgi:hypothetical protein
MTIIASTTKDGQVYGYDQSLAQQELARKRVANEGHFVHTPAAKTEAQLVEEARLLQISKNSFACATAITAGQKSNALGSEYTYPTGLSDQLNLSAAVNASLSGGSTLGWTTSLMCADANNNWAFVAHTAAQVQQVGVDVNNAIAALRVRNASLTTLINAAITTAVVLTTTF